MDEPTSSTQVRPPLRAVDVDDAVDDLEERLAREDLSAAQLAVNGAEYARSRAWRLHLRARIRHPRWAADLLARVQLAQARESEARADLRAAAQQLDRIEADRKLRAPARAKAAAHERDLMRVVKAFSRVEEAARKMKKAAAVKEELDMSLPTYRSYVAEARARGLLS